MPNGFGQAPLLKQLFAALRKQGLLSVVYLDDPYLQGELYAVWLHNITTTTHLLAALRFKENVEKSVLLPTRQIEFLGFILDSVTMTLSLPEQRQVRILALCKKLQEAEMHTIRAVASAIGT